MIVSSPTELTTSLTDAILAIESLGIFLAFRGHHWHHRIWRWIFGLLAFSSLLGSIAHGLAMPENLRELLWKPLYLSLGLMMALFLVAAIADGSDVATAKRLIPFSIAAGIVFFVLTELFNGIFIVFILYEAIVMLGALLIYAFLAYARHQPGAGVISVAILINLLAAGVQSSDLSVTLLMTFDHNGLFHLIQIVGIGLLGLGAYRIAESQKQQDQEAYVA